jgi:membrane-associated phospholipid phosphatase
VSRARTVVLEVLGLLAAFVLFVALHAAAGHDTGAAAIHADTLQTVERVLHLDVERGANAWLAGHPVLITVAVVVYRSYYLAVVGVLLWVAVRHAEAFGQVRRTLLTMLGLILLVYWALPLSPPRFALAGVVDLVATHDLVRNAGSGNQFSAMPSSHVALAAWCAYAVWFALRPAHPRLALLAWLFPVVMVAVVLGTGNHYVLDVVASAVLLGVSIVVATLVPRLIALARHG